MPAIRTSLRVALGLVSSLVILAACDSTVDPPESPTDGSDVVGSWVSETHVQTTFVTSDRDQETIDVNRVGGGAVAFSGAADGALRFASRFVGQDGRASFVVFTNDAHSHPFPDAYAFLSLDPYQTTLTVWRSGAYRQFSVTHDPDTLPYRFTGNRLSVAGVRLTAPDGATVDVRGTLDTPVLRLAAGVEQTIERQVSAEDAGDRRIVFERTGRFQLVRVGRTPLDGMWDALGDGRIRLTIEGPDGVVTELTHRVEAGRLALSTTSETCRDDPNRTCRAYVEQQFSLAPGSLTRVRQETGDVYAPAP